jgi:hypothetical protein
MVNFVHEIYKRLEKLQNAKSAIERLKYDSYGTEFTRAASLKRRMFTGGSDSFSVSIQDAKISLMSAENLEHNVLGKF